METISIERVARAHPTAPAPIVGAATVAAAGPAACSGSSDHTAAWRGVPLHTHAPVPGCRTVRSLGLSACLLAATGSIVAQPITASTPGTRFAFAITDRWNKDTGQFELEVVEQGANGVTVRQSGTGEPFSFTIASGGEITRPKPTTSESWSYKAVPFPLNEGAEWEWTFFQVSASQQTLTRFTYTCKAGAVDEVTVPAGRFSTRRYDCRGVWTSGSASGPVTRKGWFSPDLNVSVRIEEETRAPRHTDFAVTQLTLVSRR